MKKTYAAPEVEVSAVSAQDILSASGEQDSRDTELLLDAGTLFTAISGLSFS